MTPNEIYRHSTELRKVLNNDSFLKAVELLRQDYQNRFFASRLEDRASREGAFIQAKALDDLLISMETIIAASQSYEASEEEL